MFKKMIFGGFGGGQVRAAFLAALNPVFSTVGGGNQNALVFELLHGHFTLKSIKHGL